MNIEAALNKALALKASLSLSQAYTIAWLPVQLAYLRHPDDGTFYLFRAGNRAGKTTVGAAEIIYRCMGSHPYKKLKVLKGPDGKPRPPKIAVINFSKTQSVPIQEIIWNMVDKTALIPGTTFSPKVGFGGHKVVLQFKNGATVEFFTIAQGAEALAGAEFDYIWMDEPPTREVFDECAARVQNTSGSIGITLTPINMTAPIDWLEEAVEKGVVKEYHQMLTAESQISPLTGKCRVDKDGRPWDEARIAEYCSTIISIDKDVRIHGAWRQTSAGQFFNKFSKETMTLSKEQIKTYLYDKDVKVEYFVGIDYAAADRDAGLIAVLTAKCIEKIEKETLLIDKVTYFVLDEVVLNGARPLKEFAREIVIMLQGWSLNWSSLSAVYGDNPVITDKKNTSSTLLQNEIRKILDKKKLYPEIRNVKAGAGGSNSYNSSKDVRCKWLYGVIEAEELYIETNLKWIIEALNRWEYSDNKSEYKDVLDAAMYSFKDSWAVTTRIRKAPTTIIT